MKRSERAIQYLGRVWEGNTKAASTERKKRTTLKAYLLQDSEATSREAKLRWGWENGIRVIRLQHDRVVAMVQGDARTEEVANGMAAAATAGIRIQSHTNARNDVGHMTRAESKMKSQIKKKENTFPQEGG